MFYWDYYLYTRNREFLRRRALPFMEESVAFFEDFLTEGADGKYIVTRRTRRRTTLRTTRCRHASMPRWTSLPSRPC